MGISVKKAIIFTGNQQALLFTSGIHQQQSSAYLNRYADLQQSVKINPIRPRSSVDRALVVKGFLMIRGDVSVRSGRATGYLEVETAGRGGATIILPGETEAGTAGTQPC